MDRENESPGQNLTLGNDVLDVLSVQLTDDLKERSGLVYEAYHHTPGPSTAVTTDTGQVN